jgi:aminoglycoside phosphotransferase (APT) family kinase protein
VEIRQLVARTEALGRHRKAQPPAFGVCHCDIHTDNVMVDRAGRLWIVDWDALLLAPKERDLMFIWQRPRGEHSAAPFWQDMAARRRPGGTACYRYEWVVQEIGDYGERYAWRRNRDSQSRGSGGFARLFEPATVAQAYAAERELYEPRVAATISQCPKDVTSVPKRAIVLFCHTWIAHQHAPKPAPNRYFTTQRPACRVFEWLSNTSLHH